MCAGTEMRAVVVTFRVNERHREDFRRAVLAHDEESLAQELGCRMIHPGTRSSRASMTSATEGMTHTSSPPLMRPYL